MDIDLAIKTIAEFFEKPQVAAYRIQLERIDGMTGASAVFKRIAAAKATPRRQVLSEIAAALREITAAAPELRSRELDDFVRECDTATYAPGDAADTSLDPEVIRRAEALLATMKEALQ